MSGNCVAQDQDRSSSTSTERRGCRRKSLPPATITTPWPSTAAAAQPYRTLAMGGSLDHRPEGPTPSSRASAVLRRCGPLPPPTAMKCPAAAAAAQPNLSCAMAGAGAQLRSFRSSTSAEASARQSPRPPTTRSRSRLAAAAQPRRAWAMGGSSCQAPPPRATSRHLAVRRGCGKAPLTPPLPPPTTKSTPPPAAAACPAHGPGRAGRASQRPNMGLSFSVELNS
mmetsp:Transcript_37619/g.104697  ORF Transcript_37619/g.104697 Transcript_37619/m.104697 type:complete len:225 (+) Transcript_37619:226-900(+)